MGDVKPTVSFHERYTSDPEFQRQVDEGRKRAAERRSQAALKDSLRMVRGEPGAPSKRY